MIKSPFHITLFLLSVILLSCTRSVITPPPVSASHEALADIDSLMWHQSDSALKVMMQFAASPEVDSLNEFDGHYCQVLVAELLFKNDKVQTNRAELKAAMTYFDSLVASQGRYAPRAAAPDPIAVFIDARAHYMNGVGYKEHDSLPEACAEYLRALQIMENRFAENELTGRKATFMALTYNRLLELFSNQLMQEPAIYCCKQSLHYNEIEPVGATNRGGVLYFIGRQYHKLNAYDSAAYYFDAALAALPDTLNLYYRDIVSAQALLEFNRGGNPQHALHTLKRMLAQAAGESERMTRNVAIGAIYKEEQLYDSAKAYWKPVFEEDPMRAMVVAPHLSEIALCEGDTAKASLYAQIVAQKASFAGEKQARVSQLNDLFQNYLLEKQEAASIREHKEDVKKATRIIVPIAILIALAIIVLAKLRSRKLLKEQRTASMQQVRAMLPQRVADIYHSNVNNRMERILAEFEAAYPHALERLASAYPDLNEAERQIAVLNFLRFRSKEEADLTGFTENTTLKYRSNLHKRAGSDPISALLAEGKI